MTSIAAGNSRGYPRRYQCRPASAQVARLRRADLCHRKRPFPSPECGAPSPLNAKFAKRRGLSRRELLAIYCLTTIGAPLMAHGIPMRFPSSVIGWQCYARVNPQWVPAVLPLVPNWFAPADPAAVDGFFQGRTTVPWSAWWTPLAA